MLPGIYAGSIAAAILAAALWEVVSHNGLILWLGCFLSIQAVRHLSYSAFHKASPREGNRGLWFILGTSAAKKNFGRGSFAAFSCKLSISPASHSRLPGRSGGFQRCGALAQAGVLYSFNSFGIASYGRGFFLPGDGQFHHCNDRHSGVCSSPSFLGQSRSPVALRYPCIKI